MPEIGTDFTVGRDFVKAASETKTLTFSDGSTITADVSSDSQNFNDVYYTPFKVGANVNYGLTDSTEVFFGVKYTKAEARTFKALKVDGGGGFLGVAVVKGDRINGEFNDYRDFGFGVGVRHFFNRFGAFAPYFSLDGGLKYNKKIELELSTATGRIRDIGFYDDAWNTRLGFGGGFLYDISNVISVGVESGMNYDYKMNDDDSDLDSAGDFDRANNDGSRFSIPIMFSFKLKF